MKNTYGFEKAINFIKKEITFSLLIILNVTAYSNPIDKSTDRKTDYNFLRERPSFTSWPNSKEKGSYSTDDCTYTLSANGSVTSGAGIGTVAVTAGAACAWTATKDADWITFTTGLSGTGNGSVGYSYIANPTWSSRRGRITIAGQTYIVTQAPRPLSPDSYEPNNTVAQAHTYTPVFVENASTFNISPANSHNSEDVDIYKINLGVGYAYRVRAILYYKRNQIGDSDHTFDGEISYSTNGSTWNALIYRRLWGLTVQGEGGIYFKIVPFSHEGEGSYAVKIDINIAGTSGCTFSLSGTRRESYSQAGSGQITVTTTSSCFRAAFTDYPWITLTSGQSGTGSGSVAYTYKANMSESDRAGVISIAGHTFTITQEGRDLLGDSYEPNNTVAQVSQAAIFTPTFTENASLLSISTATCHNSSDIDIYKINLEAGYSYSISGALYNAYNQIDNSNYALYGKVSYSINGTNWLSWGNSQLLNKTVQGVILYLKIEPDDIQERNVGTYAAKIDINRVVDCNPLLSLASREVSSQAGNGLVTATTNPLCTSPSPWTAASNSDWITLTSGLGGTGNGSVGYSYTANTTWSSRSGTITIGVRTYTVTQLPPSLTPDSYEGSTGNNTAAQACIFPQPVFNNEYTSTLSISPANCHQVDDVDIYKINLEAGYIYTIGGALYDRYNQTGGSSYTLNVKGFYSTNGTHWISWGDSQLAGKTVQAGTHYLKIQPDTRRDVGTYAARIDIQKTSTVACTYVFPVTSKELTWEAKTDQQVEVTTSSSGDLSCLRRATSNVNWLRITSGQSGTGSGQVVYSYDANTTTRSRTGEITIADKTYTVTQNIRPDENEPNNTAEEATLLTVTIPDYYGYNVRTSVANCHNGRDIDIYKINLEADYHYSIRGDLYCERMQRGSSNRAYTLDKPIIYYSTDGATWEVWGNDDTDHLPEKAMPWAETLYLKVESYTQWYVGTYEVDIKLGKSAGCTYNLSPKHKRVPAEGGLDRITVAASSLCTSSWTASSHAGWITLTSGQNTTGSGSGNVAYSCKPNMASSSRRGTIRIAGQTYTITQEGRPLVADSYEPNNTVQESQAQSITPAFTENAGSVSISATCHNSSDIDIYKINLETDYSYTISGNLYNAYYQVDNNNYTLAAEIFYSTDGSNWNYWEHRPLRDKTVRGRETLYIKIAPYNNSGNTGTYAAKIDIIRVVDCSLYLLPASSEISSGAGHSQATVATSSLCTSPASWTAASNVNWITLTSGQSGTGSGIVGYSYTENTEWASRTGTITIANQTYTVTQLPPPLTPDGYEGNTGNNTAEQGYSFPDLVFNNENVSTIFISPANCHNVADVDFYKINLRAGYSYTIGGAFQDLNNQIDNSNYTLRAKISYSIDGTNWNLWQAPNLSNVIVPAGTLYLKVEPYTHNTVGTYTARIDIKIAVATGCNYTLSALTKAATLDAGIGEVDMTATGSSCSWTATSNEPWIRLTAGLSGTGSGSVSYTYKANMARDSRTGTIIIAGQTYTITQEGRPLSSDSYEPNDRIETVTQAATFTPAFIGNTSTISISANCHHTSDIDYYKINLADGYSYTISGALYNAYNQIDNSNYPLYARISYIPNITDIFSSNHWGYSQLPEKTAQGGGIIYIKIQPNYTFTPIWNEGAYAVKIDIIRTSTIACTYTLPVTHKEVTWEAKTNEQAEVRTNSSGNLSCTWTATSYAGWITIISSQSGIGNGHVIYSYDANTAQSSRTGTITIAGQTYTLTQAGRPLVADNYEPDMYEENNTMEQASILTPGITQNSGFISISANLHREEDVDFYKINLGASTYAVSVNVYYDNHYTDGKISYSTDAGSTWSAPVRRIWSDLAVQGTIYLKINSDESSPHSTGPYNVRIYIHTLATAGCTYRLPVASRQATWEAGAGKVDVETTGACAWLMISNAEWIRLITSQSKTGSGSMDYSYTENISTNSRTGMLTVGNQTYTITQGPIQADGYEENNTVAQANHSRSAFTPVFTQNASTISISPANCHRPDDIDIYKINLGTDPCVVRAVLYDSDNRIDYRRDYMLNAKISYSTDGATWSVPEDSQLPGLTANGTLYLKIVPAQSTGVGSYAVKIDINKASSPGCTYSLPAADKQATWEAGSGLLSVITNSSCVWAAISNVSWITVNSGSRAGSGVVRYSYKENTTTHSRTGTITVADKNYTVTQAPLQADAYEENNTVEQANLRPALTPEFAENTGLISISSANCHTNEDVDIYKINLGTDSCVVSVELYHRYQYFFDRNRNIIPYTLAAKISYSTDGIVWQYSHHSQFSNLGVKGTLYLKIQPDYSNSSREGSKGSYVVKIDINKAVTAGCTYSLKAAGREATAEAGAGQAEITTNSSCVRTAASKAEWIRITSGQSGTGSGSINYTYTENMEMVSRKDTIKVAGQNYIVRQAAAQPLSPDSYEPNETKETAYSLTPVFTQNTSTLSISPANCHHEDDVDFYKINLGTEYNTYTIRGALSDRASDTKNYTLYAQVSYSTDGSVWHKPESGRLWELTLAGGTLYLKILRSSDYNEGRRMGSYAAKIDITGGCTYSLSTVTRATSDAGSGRLTVTANSSGNLSCPWSATSNVDWITFASGQSGTGSGNVGYAYTKNMTRYLRTGKIMIAGQTCTVTQEAATPLTPDGYEENNTVAEARLLTPVFTQNKSTISISPANCHDAGDDDFYIINFGTDNDSYTVTGVLYDRDNQIDNSSYTLDGGIYFSTNGSTFTDPGNSRLPNLTLAAGETLYLKIAPNLRGGIGTYAVKIDIIGGCTYTLPVAEKGVAHGAGSSQLAVAVKSSGNVTCPQTATSNAEWIKLTSGMRITGAGDVGYTYTENTGASPRTGTIIVAGHIYTVTQAGRPLPPDAYEPNNTVAQATLLTPVFTQNAGTLSISQVNCHHADDVDIYKINLEAGSYTVSAMLSDSYNDSRYTLDAKISYSTDGATWSVSKDSQLQGLTVQGGTLYLRIEPFSGLGTYAAKIDVLKTTAGCTYSLPVVSKRATYEAGSDQVTVTTNSSCAWTATANVAWITLASDQSKTGSGNMGYSYTENMAMDSRTGMITIAGQTYTVTQAAHPLSPDGYEENNTAEQAGARSTFTPVFTQKESSIFISPANCHHIEDVDIYKINLQTGSSYTINTELCDRSRQINNSNYSLDAGISYSTDGSTWSKEERQLPNLFVQGGTHYLKISPLNNGNRVGFYAAKIDIKIIENCTYKLPASSKEVTAAAGSDKIDITVTGGSSCEWTATSHTDWITLKSGQSGKGSGSTEYAYSENKTASSRTGTITVAGQTFTVTQSVITGIETTGNVKIFPNPAGDFVTIDFSGSTQKYASVKIANQSGQILYVQDSPNETLQISLKGFAGGMYFIFLQGEEKMWVEKLVVH